MEEIHLVRRELMRESRGRRLSVLVALALVLSLVLVLAAPQTALAWDPVTLKSTTGVQDSDGSTWLEKYNMLEVIKVGANGVIDPPDPSKPYYIGGDDEIARVDWQDPNEHYLIYIGLGYPFGTNGRFRDACDGMLYHETVYVRAWNGGAGSYSATFEECIVNATHYGDSETWLIDSNPEPPWEHDFGTWCTNFPKPVAGFTIEGDVYEADGTTPYNDPLVTVTNLNTENGWEAMVDPPGGNHYTLTLTGADIPGEGHNIHILARKTADQGEDTIGSVDHAVNAIDLANNGFTENVNLDHYYLNWTTYPYSVWEDPPGDTYSAAAVMQMCLEHYSVSMNQTDLYDYGLAHNGYDCSAPYIDADGVEDTLDNYASWPEHNYTVGYGMTLEEALARIAYWQHTGPGTVPTGGNWARWMAVRGIHTDKEPTTCWTNPDYTVYGFWLNDPQPQGGIGENSYKTVGQWADNYYSKILDDPSTRWYDSYVTCLEPPENDAEVTLADSPARFDVAIEPMMVKKMLVVEGTEGVVSVKAVRDREALKVIQAAIDGVTEQLIPVDAQFADVFARTVAGQPLLVSDEGGDYYLVPFDEPVKVKPRPWRDELESFAGKAVERDRGRIWPVPIKPTEVKANTAVVVIVDAQDGSFQEASWVSKPVEYLRVSKAEALRLVFKELGVRPFEPIAEVENGERVWPPRPNPPRVSIELVDSDTNPYQPHWKITIGDKVFFVDQDGNVRS